MALKYYPAVVHKDDDSDYGVSFPDLPGCVTAGSTAQEALANAVEVLALHVSGLVAEGMEVPAPSAFDLAAAEREGGTLTYVPLLGARGGKRRLNITLDEYLIGEIDAVAEGNRSEFLAEAARLKLGYEVAGMRRQQKKGVKEKVAKYTPGKKTGRFVQPRQPRRALDFGAGEGKKQA